MAAGAGANRNEPVDALVHRLLGMADVDDVVEDDTAIGMGGIDHRLRRPERGDDDRHLMLGADLHVVHQPVVGGVADLVDGEGRRLLAGLLLECGELGLDLHDPFGELFGRPRIERRERADDARLALGDDEFGPRNDEERRADDRQAQTAFENLGKRHGMFP